MKKFEIVKFLLYILGSIYFFFSCAHDPSNKNLMCIVVRRRTIFKHYITFYRQTTLTWPLDFISLGLFKMEGSLNTRVVLGFAIIITTMYASRETKNVFPMQNVLADNKCLNQTSSGQVNIVFLYKTFLSGVVKIL